MDKVGGYYKLEKLYMEASPSVRVENSTCGDPPSDAFHLLRDPVLSDQPWPGLILQSSLGCLWYWCCDQVTDIQFTIIKLIILRSYHQRTKHGVR